MNKFTPLFRHALVQNTLSLFGVQVCRKLLPLVSIPYLARTLHPEGWGIVAFVSSLGDFVVMAIEFGFNLSATREIAQNRESPDVCGKIASGVIACQLLLASVAVAVVLALSRHLPVVQHRDSLLWAGLLYGVAQGLNPIWFFQGLERIPLAAAVEVTGKLLALVCLFIFVHEPGQEWRVLALQAVPALLSTAVGYWLALRVVKLRWPRPALVWRTLASSFPLFLFRSGEGLFGAGNAFILGFFAPPASVGYYSMAERISRAIFGLMDPIRESLFPRLNNLMARSQQRAAMLARLGAGLMIAGGVLLGAGIYLFAPLMVRMAGSHAFTPAVTVLRIFAILPLILAITHSVGVQWLLSLGKDRAVIRIMLTAGVFNILLAALLAPRFAHFGMAWAVVCTEVLVCLGMVLAVRRTGAFWAKEAVRDRKSSSGSLSLRLGNS